MRKYKITNGSKNTWYEDYNGMVFECAEISNTTSHVEVVKGNFIGRTIRIEDCKPIIDEIPIKNIGMVKYRGEDCPVLMVNKTNHIMEILYNGNTRYVNPFNVELGDLRLYNEDYDHVNPDHYKTNDKEVWEYMIEIYGLDKFIAFCELNVFKYSMRVGRKPGATVEDDLGKIKWYAEKIKELRDE